MARRGHLAAVSLMVMASTAWGASDLIPADQVCASSDRVFVGPCFNLHARLMQGGDNIEVRIWPVGTKRQLGWAGDAKRCSLPPTLEALMAAAKTVYADIVVRPVSQSRPGTMQFVCIAAVQKLVIRDHPE